MMGDFGMAKWKGRLKIIIGGVVMTITIFFFFFTAILLYVFDRQPFYSQLVLGFYDLIDVKIGSNHIVGLKSDGTVVAFGVNSIGQGDVSEWTDIIAISVGSAHTVGLKSDGTVVATGWNFSGQCNVSEWYDIVAISAAGNSHTAGLKSNGTVVSTDEDINRAMTGWNDIVAISATDFYVAGVRSDGTVLISENRWSIFDVSDWYDIVAVEASYGFIYGLTSSGSAVIVTNEKERIHPFELPDLSDWSNMISISASAMMGVKSDGTVVSLGTFPGFLNDPTDWQDITKISTSTTGIVGLTADGTIEVLWFAEQQRMIRQYGMGRFRRFIDDTWGEFSRMRDEFGGQDPNIRRQNAPFFRTLIDLVELRRLSTSQT
jgi:hypothetical protein